MRKFLDYIDSKIAIGVIRSRFSREFHCGLPKVVVLVGLSQEMWDRIIGPEVHRIIKVKKVQFYDDVKYIVVPPGETTTPCVTVTL